MDTDDLTEMAWEIIAQAAQVSDTLKADLGARSGRYGNEDDWLRGVLKFLKKIVDSPSEYVDYWNLEEEEGVTAAMMREIAADLSRRAKETLAKSSTQRVKQGEFGKNMSLGTGPFFTRYIGIDYSGAQTPITSLKGLRVFLADRKALPMEVPPPPSPRMYWTRRGIAEWLVERLTEEVPSIVGIDHGFSFPLRYFEVHHLLPDWPTFLDDFQRHWPTDEDDIYVDFVRNGTCGNGEARSGNSRWRRLTEEHAGSAKSVFHYDVPGQVAKSTHAGLPWLRYLRQRLGERIHFWPFDGWEFPSGRSSVVEVYPSLWRRSFAREDRTADQHDAYAAAAWLRQADLDGRLAGFLDPSLSPAERTVAQVEGWILGVM